MFPWNVWGEPLMSSPWAKRVWLAVKNKIRHFQVQSFCQNLFSDWYAPFSGSSHMIDSAPITRNWTGSGKGIMPKVGSVWKNTFLLLRLLLYAGVRTAFKGCRLPTSCQKAHRYWISLIKNSALLSGVVGSSSLPLKVRFRYHSLYNMFHYLSL